MKHYKIKKNINKVKTKRPIKIIDLDANKVNMPRKIFWKKSDQ